MAQDDQTPSEDPKGSIIPAVGGAAVGGTAGAVWGYRNSQKKAARGLTIDKAAHGTHLGLVKEHIEAAEKGHVADTGLAAEWKRLVEEPMTQAPQRQTSGIDDSVAYKKAADLSFRSESEVYKLNKQHHELSARLDAHQENAGKRVLEKQAAKLEAQLHNAAAEHLVSSRGLKRLDDTILKDMGGVTGKLPRGGAGKTIAGAAVLATVGGLAAQAFFGRAERPHPSHAARIRAEQAAASQQQGQGQSV